MSHPIGSLPFDKRRLFALEVIACTRRLLEALDTNVVCQPAKLVALYMVLVGLAPDECAEDDAVAEARLLVSTLETSGAFDEPDPKMLRVILASMRANPDEDALSKGDVIELDALSTSDN